MQYKLFQCLLSHSDGIVKTIFKFLLALLPNLFLISECLFARKENVSAPRRKKGACWRETQGRRGGCIISLLTWESAKKGTEGKWCLNRRKESMKGTEQGVVTGLGCCGAILEAGWPRAAIPLM